MKILKQHASIEIGREIVTKIADPDRMRVEAEKTRRAYEIGRDCGLFQVPRVIDYDNKNGVLILEKLSGILPLTSISSRTRSWVEAAGRSLAAIHQHLALPQSMSISLPSDLHYEKSEVFLHGDFNAQNVCVSPESGKIVVLDWQMTSRHGGEATFGSRYFDVIWFVNYLIWTPRLRHVFRSDILPLVEIFIVSYFRECDQPFERRELHFYAKRFFEGKAALRLENSTWRTMPLLRHSSKQTKKFIDGITRFSL